MDQVMAVKTAWQCAHERTGETHFANAYDGFWQTLGGVATPGRSYRIALPLDLRPLSEMPSRHRKRAAMRREQWRAIGESAGLALQGHLRPMSARASADLYCPAG
jgi:uncharacterized protein VirK/YbjX